MSVVGSSSGCDTYEGWEGGRGGEGRGGGLFGVVVQNKVERGRELGGYGSVVVVVVMVYRCWI